MNETCWQLPLSFSIHLFMLQLTLITTTVVVAKDVSWRASRLASSNWSGRLALWTGESENHPANGWQVVASIEPVRFVWSHKFQPVGEFQRELIIVIIIIPVIIVVIRVLLLLLLLLILPMLRHDCLGAQLIAYSQWFRCLSRIARQLWWYTVMELASFVADVDTLF